MKYKLTDEKIIDGITFYQIEALKDFGFVSKGGKGGYISKEKNLAQSGGAWVFDNAKVSGDAQVYGDARVSGNAWVSGDARVYSNAKVFDNAWVSGDAQVYGDASVYDYANVSA